MDSINSFEEKFEIGLQVSLLKLGHNLFNKSCYFMDIINSFEIGLQVQVLQASRGILDR